MLPSRFSFFGGGGSKKVGNSVEGGRSELNPTLKLQTDRDVYRAGDSVYVTIEICNPLTSDNSGSTVPSLLIERLGFEIKGIEKLDTQWFATQKPLAGTKRKRGEHVFLDCSTPSMVSNQIVPSGSAKTCIVPATTIQTDTYWKEMGGDAEWLQARVSDMYDGVEEGYESSRDEISSVSSYNPSKENLYKTFGSSLSLQSTDRLSLSSNVGLPRLSVAEVLHDSNADILPAEKPSAILSPSQQWTPTRSLAADDITGVSSAPSPRATESVASEGFIRGRSYNIRMDDQILLRFSPKNSESTYYFSDMIGGTLTFFHEEGTRRCLEVSVTLETSETINRRFVHPSRRNSPTITKVQSDHHEVVADLVQTSFLFSIPMDGPMSFSTPHVSVQWALRFEFFTTPKNVDWTRYEHPLLIEGRDKSEWVLPITVHAPPTGTPAAHTRNEKPFSLESLWVHG
ncbi:uncharacterized protein LOC111294180 isoform X4 [Durio zibethinus]|uniref:Uncharacterized protein LOC111294180 isoform X4 n=1 Tax=Durio zibethinus TaxID=66656 RepID=A0A6P5YRK1_DURZI|nr:uncharacterized protein LOC111294180 isoform X4 [Durio zibethinus]